VSETFTLIAKTSFGFEDILAEELKNLGATKIEKLTRAVSFEGDAELMYKVNLWSRVALRILKPIRQFKAAGETQLYNEIKKIDWSQYMSADDTLAIDAVVNNSQLTHSLYVALKSKDAIVDQFRDNTGKRPNVDLNKPTLRVHVHIYEDEAEVSLDSSGESLHIRGYRAQHGEAPLNEALAAGMIIVSGWDKQSPFTDLMCGSGTLVIEAAMLARNIPPSILRKEFAFQRWKDYDQVLWNKIVEEAKAGVKEKVNAPITGIDKSYHVLDIAKQNAIQAGVSDDIDFRSQPFEDYTPKSEPGTIITNPPYGGRITDSEQDLFLLYEKIGASLKHRFSGWTAWIFTANREAANHIGLKPSRRIPLYNGPLECRLLKYEMYKGTKRIGKDQPPIA
jgi:putative N6-adenine-specific DNA methylase